MTADFRILKNEEELVEIINSHGQRLKQLQQQDELEAFRDLNETQWHTLGRYSSLILVAGYAAFFTMWSSVKNDLSKPAMFASGLLATASVCLFLSFEVAKMFLTQRLTVRISNAFNKADASTPTTVFRDVIDSESKRASRIWPFFFWPTILSGFGAGAILGWAFLDGLCRWFAS